MNKAPKNPSIFICELCAFKCSNKKDYGRHTLTAKHKNRTIEDQKTPQVINTCECGKTYKYSRGLWTHKKACNSKNNDVNMSIDKSDEKPIDKSIDKSDDKSDDSQLVVMELLQEMKEDNKHLREQMIEMAKHSGNNITNNITNQFNLNVYLNETCKDAITLDDFIKSIELNVDDFIRTGEIGFVKGISQVMVERIRDMEPHNRPIHCTDLKRETVYIKEDNKWEKEDVHKTKLRKAVKKVAHMNQQQLHTWQDDNPNFEILNTPECEKFIDYSQASLGGYGDEEDEMFENKIMNNVLKEVVLDKEPS
jgi:hypothetical protein